MVRNEKVSVTRDEDERVEVDKEDILFCEPRLMELSEKYGNAFDIKLNVKTTAHIYEIRTALRFWRDDRRTHRESKTLWVRLEHYSDGATAEEAMKL